MTPVTEMIKRIRSLSNDKQATGYDTEDILSAINDAVLFVGRMIQTIRPNLISEEKQGTLNQNEYTIKFDEQFLGILNVRINGLAIRPTQIWCIENLNNKDEAPSCYYIKNFNTICVNPIPTKDVDYVISYIPANKKLSIDDSTPYPNDFDNIIIEYANARLNISNEYDMSQEMSIIQVLTSQIEELLYQFPDTQHHIQSCWDCGTNENNCGSEYIKGYW